MKSHAVLDRKSRGHKAKKIDSLVRLYGCFGMRSMLEVGSGAGFIAQYFSKMGYGVLGTHAVDIADERQIKEGFQFRLVEDTVLPFPDGAFDFVISNHVVEHVGANEEQESHISEVYRCLEPGGIFYFAVPNCWRIIEPHYKIPLLSWLPQKKASILVRFFRRASHYDCNPLSRRDAIKLLGHSGFEYQDVTLDAISILGEIEGGFFTRWIAKLPQFFWKPFLAIMPTLIFVCRKPMP